VDRVAGEDDAVLLRTVKIVSGPARPPPVLASKFRGQRGGSTLASGTMVGKGGKRAGHQDEIV